MKKRLLSVLLTLSMVLTLLPSTALAAGEESLTGEPVEVSASDLYVLLGGGEGQEECEATLEEIQELLGAEEVYLELEGGTREESGDAVIRVSAEKICLVTYQEPAQLPGVSDETEGTPTVPADRCPGDRGGPDGGHSLGRLPGGARGGAGG